MTKKMINGEQTSGRGTFTASQAAYDESSLTGK